MNVLEDTELHPCGTLSAMECEFQLSHFNSGTDIKKESEDSLTPVPSTPFSDTGHVYAESDDSSLDRHIPATSRTSPAGFRAPTLLGCQHLGTHSVTCRKPVATSRDGSSPIEPA